MKVESHDKATRITYQPNGSDVVLEMWFVAHAEDARAQWLAHGNPTVVLDAGLPSEPVTHLAEAMGLPCAVSIEVAQTPHSLVELWSCLIDAEATSVLAIGGGTMSDVAGFAASTYRRGIPLQLVPTTVLSAIDASIGGKNGLDIGSHKNAVGTVHWPATTICCTDLIDTRSLAGFAEGVKIAALFDEELFVFLETNSTALVARDSACITDLLWRSAAVKARAVESLPLEDFGLLYGHNIGHAVESAMNGKLDHGTVVSIGINVEAAIAVDAGVLSKDVWERQTQMLKALDIPARWPTELEPSAVVALLSNYKLHDEKDYYFVVPSSLGSRYESAGEGFLRISRDGFEDVLARVLNWAG